MTRKSSPFARRHRKLHLGLELLETRALMSASPFELPLAIDANHPQASYAEVDLDGAANPGNTFATPLVSAGPAGMSSPSSNWITPAQARAAYGFDKLAFDGAGQTIAIVVAFDDPGIRQDLTTFDQKFGLPEPPSFTTVRRHGPGGAPLTFNASWAREAALDVEWAHAIAPKANIVLAENFDSSTAGLMSMVDYCRNMLGVSVVSMSWAVTQHLADGTVVPAEIADEATTFDPLLTTPANHTPVTFVAASGDWASGATYPASSPNIVSVGGTKLTLSNGTYGSETAWSKSVASNGQIWGSGGGISEFEPQPSFIHDVMPSIKRTTPDVSYNGDPNSAFAVFHAAEGGWTSGAGTSAGTPQWAGLFALANQGRAQQGHAALGTALKDMYALPSTDFHDITTGSNGFATLTGYDMVTGRGTPKADLVVADLMKAELLRVDPTRFGTLSLASSTSTSTKTMASSQLTFAAATVAGDSAADKQLGQEVIIALPLPVHANADNVAANGKSSSADVETEALISLQHAANAAWNFAETSHRDSTAVDLFFHGLGSDA